MPSFFRLVATLVVAQGGGSQLLRDGSQLDSEGKTREAKVLFQKAIDASPDAAAKAQAWRGMAMSYAFDGDCAGTVKYEELVIAYWVTRSEERRVGKECRSRWS